MPRGATLNIIGCDAATCCPLATNRNITLAPWAASVPAFLIAAVNVATWPALGEAVTRWISWAEMPKSNFPGAAEPGLAPGCTEGVLGRTAPPAPLAAAVEPPAGPGVPGEDEP